MSLLLSLVLSGVTVILPTDVEVRGTEMTVGDVARVAGEDADEVARVSAVSLGHVPAPGYSRLLRRENFARAIRRNEPTVSVSFGGFDALRVRPAVEEIATARIRDLAQQELALRLGNEDASATERGTLQPLVVPRGDEPAEIFVRPLEGEVTAGDVNVPVEVWVDGALYRTVWTRWRIEMWQTVPVLARGVRAGEALSPQLFVAERVQLGQGRAKRSLAMTQLAGATAARDLAAGTIVTDLDVQRPRVVQLGDTVFVQVRKNGVTARVLGIARAAGAVGDRIRVETLEGAKELSAVIKSRDLVEIDLSGGR